MSFFPPLPPCRTKTESFAKADSLCIERLGSTRPCLATLSSAGLRNKCTPHTQPASARWWPFPLKDLLNFIHFFSFDLRYHRIPSLVVTVVPKTRTSRAAATERRGPRRLHPSIRPPRSRPCPSPLRTLLLRREFRRRAAPSPRPARHRPLAARVAIPQRSVTLSARSPEPT